MLTNFLILLHTLQVFKYFLICDYLEVKLQSGTILLINSTELVAFIEGGAQVIRGLHENITMNASLSYDPDLGTRNNSGMNFTWHFGQIKGNNYSLPLPGLSGISVQYFAEKGFGPVVIFAKKPLYLNQTYIAKLFVTKDYRTSSVFQVIRLQNGEPPKVSLRYTFRQSLFFCCARNSICH